MASLVLLLPLLCCATILLLLHPVLGSFPPVIDLAYFAESARSLAFSPVDPSLLYSVRQDPGHWLYLFNLTTDARPDPDTIDIDPLLLPHGYTTPTQLTTLRTDSSTPSFYLFDDANHLLFIIAYPPPSSSTHSSPPSRSAAPTITAFAPQRSHYVSSFSLSPDGSIVIFTYLDDAGTLAVYNSTGQFWQSINVGGPVSTAAFPPPASPAAPADSFFFVNSSQPRRADGVYVLDFFLIQWSLSTGQQVGEVVQGTMPNADANGFYVANLVAAWDGTFVLCGSSNQQDNPCCFLDTKAGTLDCQEGYDGLYRAAMTVDGRGRLAMLHGDFRSVSIYDTTNGSAAHTLTAASSSSSSSASQRRLPSCSTAAADSSPPPPPSPPSSLSSSSTAAAGCACSTTPSCESGWSTAAVVAIALSCLCAGVLLGVVLLRVLQVCHERREDKRVQHSSAADSLRSPMLGHVS